MRRFRLFRVVVLGAALLSTGLAAQSLPQTEPKAPLGTVTPGGSDAAPSSVVRRVGMLHLRGQPGFAALALAGDQLIMSHSTTNTVDVFDIAKRRIVAQVGDMNDPAGIAVDVAAGRAYVANRGAKEIAVLSTRDWKVERRIPLDSAPRHLLLVPETGMLYTANWHQRSVSAIELKQGTARTAPINGSPVSLAWDAERRQLYASLEDVPAVAVLSPELKELKQFSIHGSLATGIAFDTAGQRIYVAVRNAIVSLDPDSGEELGRSAAPEGVSTLQLEGNRLFAAASGGVVLIYVATGKGLVAEHEVPTEVRGYSLAYSPERNLILMPGGSNGTARLLLLQLIPRAPGATVSNAR